MEVILLERIAKLGQMGEVVRVKDGYARNFLLPMGKALRAKGIGLSSDARDVTDKYIAQSTAGANTIFSAGTVNSASDLQRQVLALRSHFRKDQLSTQLQKAADDAVAKSSSVGTKVDTTA